MDGGMNRYWRRLREHWGWIDCPGCGQFRRPRWVKDYIYHPEEPPLFGHWYMPCCGVSTEVTATSIMDDAARSFGARDFNDFMEQRKP
jgi:hypothetical protein